MIVLNERHLHRLLSELVAYDHDDRTHLGLGKGGPSMRVAASKPSAKAEIVGHPRIGGLRHRYEWRQAARRPEFRIDVRGPVDGTRASERPR